MVAATQQRQQQLEQQEQQKQPSTLTPAEEEALKRNTDCVYFLASPLTCKKGSECEYRHSEYARINPRDCYFWLNGNCLNPKCGFRHPPLDGLLGTQVATSAGSSLPSSQTAVASATHAPYNVGKQAVPCIFFQKGICMKGDRCAFLHVPNPISNKPQQPIAATPATEPPSLKKPFGGLEKCTRERKIPPANASTAIGTTETKAAPKVETAPPRFGMGIERNIPPPAGLDDEVPQYKATNVSEGSIFGRSNRLLQAHVSDDQSFSNGKDADDFLRESSPGFDVLVDDQLRQSDYYLGEDQYGRSRSHDGRNSVNEYDTSRAADYKSMADDDREMFCDPRGYDSYEHMQGQYAWDHHRTSSEVVLLGPAHPERRVYSKAESPDHFEESDLRHRLSKQRRVNGLRSVVSHDYVPDNHVEERSFRDPRRDSLHLPPQERSLSNRLHGRIKLAGRSPVNGSDLRPEREMERGRSRSRLSPGRPQISHQGRLRDRIKGRLEEDYISEDRNSRAPRMRGEIMDDRCTGFAGPKSLAELKVVKNTEGKEQQSLRKRKSLEDHQQSEGDLSFKGPLPLSEILKRKREAEAAASSGSGISSRNSRNKEDNNQKEIKKSFFVSSSINAAPSATLNAHSPVSNEESNSHVTCKNDKSKSATGDAGGITEEKNEVSHVQSSLLPDVGETETEDGMIVDDGMDEHELEADDQRNGEYDYEQVDDGDYNYDEGENAEAEEEYLDDDDGDDFAKKIGVMFS